MRSDCSINGRIMIIYLDQCLPLFKADIIKSKNNRKKKPMFRIIERRS